MTAPRPHRNWKYTKTTSLLNYITSLAGIAAAVEFVPEIDGTACFGPLRNLTLCHRYAGTESDQYSPKSCCASNGWLTFRTFAVEWNNVVLLSHLAPQFSNWRVQIHCSGFLLNEFQSENGHSTNLNLTQEHHLIYLLFKSIEPHCQSVISKRTPITMIAMKNEKPILNSFLFNHHDDDADQRIFLNAPEWECVANVFVIHDNK